MSTTLRVAELETLFTGNDDGLQATIQQAKKQTEEFDGTEAKAELVADAERALAEINDLRDELHDVDSTRTRVEIEADVSRAVAEAEEITQKLKEINDLEVDPEITAQVDQALADAAEVRNELDEIDSTDVEAKVDVDTKGASAGFGEFKDEAGQTAREGAASFTGEFDDVGDVIQETLANGLAGFGPLGAAAGLAAAAGVGIVISKAQELSEETNEAAENAGALALSMRDAGDEQGRLEVLGDRFDEIATSIRDVRSAWEFWQESAVTGIEQIADVAEHNESLVAGFLSTFEETDGALRLEELQAAAGGVHQALADLGGQVEDLRMKERDSVAAMGAYVDASDDLTEAEKERLAQLTQQQDELNALLPIIEEEIRLQEQSEAITRALAEAKGLTVEQYLAEEEAAAAALEVQQAYQQALEDMADPVATYEQLLKNKEDAERIAAEKTAEATEDATDSWEDYVNDVSVSTQDLIDEWNRQAEEAEEFEQNLAIIAANGGQALADELRAKGPEVASSVAAVIAKSSPDEQRKAIEAHAGATGKDIAAEMASGITDNGWRVEAAANGVIRAVHVTEDIEVPISVTWSPSQLDSVLDNIQANTNGRRIFVGTSVVEARASGGPVEAGNTYLVGEEGPELVTFQHDGYVIPAGPTQDYMERGAERAGAASVARTDAPGVTLADLDVLGDRIAQAVIAGSSLVVSAHERYQDWSSTYAGSGGS